MSAGITPRTVGGGPAVPQPQPQFVPPGNAQPQGGMAPNAQPSAQPPGAPAIQQVGTVAQHQATQPASQQATQQEQPKMVPQLNENGQPVIGPDGQPVMVAEKQKRKPAPRATYTGGQRNEQGLLLAVPTDYSPSKNLPLAKKNFADPAVYYDFQAAQFRKKAERAEANAKQERELGDAGNRAERKRLIKLTEQIDEAINQLLRNGVSPEQIEKLRQSARPSTPQATQPGVQATQAVQGQTGQA
jgi:hypothetical protein